jgi:opacity protein-like surface antigen
MRIHKIFLLFIFFIFVSISNSVFSQDTAVPENTPVSDIFSATLNIDNQTVVTPYKGSKQFIIQHRFAQIKDIKDLYGIYGASNIRIALMYGVTDRIMIGFGTEKYSKFQDFSWKYNILQQTETGSMPIALTYYGNLGIDGRDKAVFGANFKFADRLSTFHQIIVARKFSERISIQAAGSFAHVNKTDTIYHNDAMGICIGGRAKVYNDISFLFEYNQGLPVKELRYYQDLAKPGLSFGFEIATGTHAFQLFATTYDKIIAQKYYRETKNDKFMVGFNITVKL